MDTKLNKRLRRIAHHLDAIVTVGDQGLTDNVVAEANRALTDHELIKVRLTTPAREQRAELGAQLADRCEAAIVQKIGKIVVLYRENPEADVKLSNLQRYDA